jgi:hypothetical protein
MVSVGILLCVVMLSVVMQNIAMLNVVIQSVVLLNVVSPIGRPENRFRGLPRPG